MTLLIALQGFENFAMRGAEMQLLQQQQQQQQQHMKQQQSSTAAGYHNLLWGDRLFQLDRQPDCSLHPLHGLHGFHCAAVIGRARVPEAAAPALLP